MAEKRLIRDTTNSESRKWWEAVRKAADEAPKLQYDEPGATSSGASSQSGSHRKTR